MLKYLLLCAVLLSPLCMPPGKALPAESVPVRAVMVDATHAMLVSAVPMTLSRPGFILDQPALRVTTWKLSRQRDRLLLTLSAPLSQPATLRLTGMTSNPAPELVLPLAPAVWPADRNGLVWLWEDQQSLLPTKTDAVASAVPARLIGAEAACYDVRGRLQLNAGEAAGDRAQSRTALGTCWKRRQFTLECLYTPTLTPAEFTLVRVGTLMALRRSGNQLWWEMPGKDSPVAVTTITSASPLHILISTDRQQLACYLNGQPACTAPLDGKPSWSGQTLTLGSTPQTTAGMQGTLEGLALYARAFTPDDAQRAAAASVARVRQYQPAVSETVQVVVQAELMAVTPMPTPESILPYRHALITQEYLVREVVTGAKAGVSPGQRIRVARWGILASKPTKVAEQKVGQQYRLTLESFKDHPDLERQFTVDELPEDFVLPYLLEVTRL
jgi:hypothetical protein